MKLLGTVALLLASLATPVAAAQTPKPIPALGAELDLSAALLVRDLVAKPGEAQRVRIEQGL